MDARTALLLAIGLCGLLITALSFAPWIRFENLAGDFFGEGQLVSFSIPGTEIGRVIGNDDVSLSQASEDALNPCTCRGSTGDGYLTAALGVVIGAAAALGIVWRGSIRAATLAAALGSLAALVVAGYNAVTIWWARGAATANAEFHALSGDATMWLWTLVATAITGAVLCGTVWALSVSKEPEVDESVDDELIAEGANGWA